MFKIECHDKNPAKQCVAHNRKPALCILFNLWSPEHNDMQMLWYLTDKTVKK